MESPFCHLTALSAELQNQIVDFLLLQGDVSLLRSLSRTCSFYQSLLAPYILKAVHLVNSSKGGLSVDAVARGRYRGCVQVLHYQGLAPGDSGNHKFTFLLYYVLACYRKLADLMPLLCSVNLLQSIDVEGLEH
jgi:hypothetical protein